MDAVTRARELLDEIGEFAHAEIEERTGRIIRLRNLAAEVATKEQLRATSPELAGNVEALRQKLVEGLTLDGKTFSDAKFPCGVLRSESKQLADFSTEISGFVTEHERRAGQQELVTAMACLTQALLRSNKLLTECLDKLDGWPRGIALRSAYLGKPDVARVWLQDMNDRITAVIGEIRKTMDTHDTDRPAAGGAKG